MKARKVPRMANCNQSGSETPVANVGLLTKMFVNLLKNAEDGIIDLNNAAYTLDWRCKGGVSLI